jgi:fructoselysine-6-P-deglycase FrlB-like protein
MDDLLAALPGFDAEAAFASAPEPWDYLPMPRLRSGPPWAMAESIAAQPAMAVRIGRRLLGDGSAAALADAVRATAVAGGPLVVTGCGTSEHASLAVVSILGEALRAAGIDAASLASAQAFELAQDPKAGGLVIGISHEGGTAATIAALEASRRRGARTALLTASAGSPAAAAADVVVATHELDASWCHTIGYTSPIVAATLVAGLVAGGAPEPAALRARLAEGIDAAHAAGADGTRPDGTIGATVAAARHLLVVGSGVDRTTARELTLKVEEAAWVPSASRNLETFLHGHLPATGDETALVLVLLDREATEARHQRARQALAAAGATGIRCAAILGADASAAIPEALTPGGRIVVPKAHELPNAQAALLGAAGPLQLVTLEVAHARGTNPDPIRRDDPIYLRAAELADDPEA